MDGNITIMNGDGKARYKLLQKFVEFNGVIDFEVSKRLNLCFK